MKKIIYILSLTLVSLLLFSCSGKKQEQVEEQPEETQEIETVKAQVNDVVEEEVEPEVSLPNINEATISFTTKQLEYSFNQVDALKFALVDMEDVQVRNENEIDLSKVGPQTIHYIFTLDDQIRQEDQTYLIKDTRNPTIRIKENEITIDQGTQFQPKDNIEEVFDDVDGQFAYVDTKQTSDKSKVGEEVFYENGWYTISGEYDVNQPSKYFFEVYASDKHGNTQTKEFSLVVNPVATPEPVVEKAEVNKITYIANTNSYKFHYPSCGSVKKMKESNKWVVTETRDYLIGLGYEPCKKCNP